MPSRLVVLMFESQYGAEGMLEDLIRMQEEGLIELEDAVMASRSARTRGWSSPEANTRAL